MTAQDFFDLLLIVAWCYGNGYAFAWFLAPLGLDPQQIAAWFGFVGWLLGLLGIGLRQRLGRFPLGLTFIIWPLPLVCSLVGFGWWMLDTLQGWLGRF
jgi:hypothetical protein